MPLSPRLFLSRIPKIFKIEIASQTDGVLVRWVDFELGTLDSDYPRLINFFFRPVQPGQRNFPWKKKGSREVLPLSVLPMQAVESIDWSSGLIRVRDAGAIQPADEETIARSVLLNRDILDAYVIDLQNRRLTRVNDLLLEEDQGLHLRAADTGVRALFRRLSGGLYRGYNEKELQDWKDVEFLRGDPGAVKAGAAYHRRIERLLPGEIASLADGLPYLHAAELILLLPPDLATDTLELMTPERQLQVFEELDEANALPILQKMAPDIAADLIGRLAADQARHYLERLPKASSERIIDLLRYPDNTVGGIMTNDVLALPGTLTVAEARERLCTSLQEPDFVYFLYVVDNDEDLHLRGVITLRNMLIAADSERLEEIMNPYLETLAPLDSPRQAAYQLIKRQLAALPVTSADGRLLGVVTVDAAVSLVAPNAWSTQAPRIFS